jgi:hypothetical protein
MEYPESRAATIAGARFSLSAQESPAVDEVSQRQRLVEHLIQADCSNDAKLAFYRK